MNKLVDVEKEIARLKLEAGESLSQLRQVAAVKEVKRVHFQFAIKNSVKFKFFSTKHLKHPEFESFPFF